MTDSGNHDFEMKKLQEDISKLEKKLDDVENVNAKINESFNIWIEKMDELYIRINESRCLEKHSPDSDSEEVVQVDQKQQHDEEHVENLVEEKKSSDLHDESQLGGGGGECLWIPTCESCGCGCQGDCRGLENGCFGKCSCTCYDKYGGGVPGRKNRFKKKKKTNKIKKRHMLIKTRKKKFKN